jgi:hypothetical protein
MDITVIEIWWRHKDTGQHGCVLAETAEEAKGLVQHIEARGPYQTKIVKV